MTSLEIPSEFLEVCKEAADMVLENTDEIIKIISHHDADGIAAAAIIGRALYRAGGHPHIRIIRQLNRSVIEELATDNSPFLVFLDFGSSQLDLLSKLDKQIMICDHHPPVSQIPTTSLKGKISHVNPHLFGINGTTEICAAGVSYLVAREMESSNSMMADIALVGAIGDRQDQGPKNSMLGLNRVILQSGIQEGLINESVDLRFFGRETRPIHACIEYTIDPYIPGLTGNRVKCLRYLENIGINPRDGDKWRTMPDLSQEERKILVSNLIVHMLEYGMSANQAEQIVGSVYTLLKEVKSSNLRDAREYAAIIDACGRMNSSGLGVAVAMNDRTDNFQLAINVASMYHQKLTSAISYLLENPNRIRDDKTSFRYFIESKIIDHSILSPITSIVTSNHIIPNEKPFVGLAATGQGMIKVSARGTSLLVNQGLDLGAALRAVVADESISGEAGGHNIAAGAVFPQGHEALFLDQLDTTLRKQMERLGEESITND